jgi:hypothetical protein
MGDENDVCVCSKDITAELKESERNPGAVMKESVEFHGVLSVDRSPGEVCVEVDGGGRQVFDNLVTREIKCNEDELMRKDA